MAFGKKSAIKAANREDDHLEDLKDERAEDREESKKVPAPAPVIRKKGEPQFYPKWVKLGEMPVVVENEAQEKAVLSGTAKVEIVKSAEGDRIKIV